MMHAQIERDEIVERYVLHQLPSEEEQAFEEHFFGCDECFAKVQEVERFRAGIRDATRRGLLDERSPSGVAWWQWGFAATACTTVIVAGLAAWMYFGEMRRLREQVDRDSAMLTRERQTRTELAQNTGATENPEANVALVMLQASRTTEKPTTAVLPQGAKRLVLWIEIGPSRYQTFRIDVTTGENRRVASLDHVQRGPYDALAVSLPADQLPVGEVRIRLSGQEPPPASLVGDYQLRIQKR